MLSSSDAVFFDVDGVLLDSMSAKGAAFAEALAPFGASAGTIMALHYEHGGTTRTTKIKLLLEQSLGREPTPRDIDIALRSFEESVVGKVLSCPEVAGATEALTRLSTHAHLYAISATPVEELRFLLNSRGWAPYLRGVFGFPRRKAEIMEGLLRVHGYHEDRCIMVGDSTSDRDSAREVSVPFILVKSPQGPEPVPSDLLVVEDLTGLPAWLEEHWSKK